MPSPPPFATRLLPDAPGLRAAALGVWEARPDLREAFGSPESDGFARFLALSGTLEFPGEIGRWFPPIPPEELRATACGGPTPLSFLTTSVADLETVVELFDVFGAKPWDEVESVLDFGCGCGRFLRWMPTALPGARAVGVDVRAASVEWCRANLAGEFLVGATEPPLALETDSMDLVVALSVFSHLDRGSARAWMAELARVCRPDGRILATTHGAFALAVACRSAAHQHGLEMTEDDARRMLRELDRETFLFHRSSAEAVATADGVEEGYGQAFLTPRFVAESWSDLVEPVGCVPVGLNLFQDVHVLRPRS